MATVAHNFENLQMRQVGACPVRDFGSPDSFATTDFSMVVTRSRSTAKAIGQESGQAGQARGPARRMASRSSALVSPGAHLDVRPRSARPNGVARLRDYGETLDLGSERLKPGHESDKGQPRNPGGRAPDDFGAALG